MFVAIIVGINYKNSNQGLHSIIYINSILSIPISISISISISRDCPFEEHATFYPLCDYIQRIRGIDYVNRILLENGRSK